MYDTVKIFVGGTALFLIGANVSFLMHLGRQLVSWFLIKAAAGSVLLLYICLSGLMGHPRGWRLGIGLAGVVAELIAMVIMWSSVTRARNVGEMGLVPIIKHKEHND